MVVENTLQVGYSMPNQAGFNSQMLMVKSLYLNTTAPPIKKAGYGAGNNILNLLFCFISFFLSFFLSFFFFLFFFYLLEKVPQDLFHSVYFEYEENCTHDRLLSLNYAFCHIKRLLKTSEPVYRD